MPGQAFDGSIWVAGGQIASLGKLSNYLTKLLRYNDTLHATHDCKTAVHLSSFGPRPLHPQLDGVGPRPAFKI